MLSRILALFVLVISLVGFSSPASAWPASPGIYGPSSYVPPALDPLTVLRTSINADDIAISGFWGPSAGTPPYTPTAKAGVAYDSTMLSVLGPVMGLKAIRIPIDIYQLLPNLPLPNTYVTAMGPLKSAQMRTPANALFTASISGTTLTIPTPAISSVTNATLGVVTTSTPHGFANGQSGVYITGVAGMTGVNGGPYTVTVITNVKFTFGVNTTSSGSYGGGGNTYALSGTIGAGQTLSANASTVVPSGVEIVSGGGTSWEISAPLTVSSPIAMYTVQGPAAGPNGCDYPTGIVFGGSSDACFNDMALRYLDINVANFEANQQAVIFTVFGDKNLQAKMNGGPLYGYSSYENVIQQAFMVLVNRYGPLYSNAQAFFEPLNEPSYNPTGLSYQLTSVWNAALKSITTAMRSVDTIHYMVSGVGNSDKAQFAQYLQQTNDSSPGTIYTIHAYNPFNFVSQTASEPWNPYFTYPLITVASSTNTAISGTSLTISGTKTGTIVPFMQISGSGITGFPTVVSGAGNAWTISSPQSVSGITVTYANPAIGRSGGIMPAYVQYPAPLYGLPSPYFNASGVDASNTSTPPTQNCVGTLMGQFSTLGVLAANANRITNITSANPGVVTTAANHGLVTGQSNVYIGNVVGMTGANGGPYTVISLSSNTFSFGVDTRAAGAYPTISSASWSGGVAVFAVDYDFTSKPPSSIQVTGISGGTGWNGTFPVVGVTRTTISVAITLNPGTYSSGGIVASGNTTPGPVWPTNAMTALNTVSPTHRQIVACVTGNGGNAVITDFYDTTNSQGQYLVSKNDLLNSPIYGLQLGLNWAAVGGHGTVINGATWSSTAGGQAVFTVGYDLTASPPSTITVISVAGGAAWNGTFPVVSVTSTTVTVTMTSNPGTYSSGGIITNAGPFATQPLKVMLGEFGYTAPCDYLSCLQYDIDMRSIAENTGVVGGQTFIPWGDWSAVSRTFGLRPKGPCADNQIVAKTGLTCQFHNCLYPTGNPLAGYRRDIIGILATPQNLTGVPFCSGEGYASPGFP